jgi:Type IV secretion system pilin/Transglycosylase SLT domain
MNTLKNKITFTTFIFLLVLLFGTKVHATVNHTLTMDIAGDQHINASVVAVSVENPSATTSCTAPSEAIKICTQEFLENSNITVTATPGNGEIFVSWIGCDSTNGNICLIKLMTDRHSYANFKKGEASSSDGTYHVLAPIPGFGSPGDPPINANFKLGTYVATIFKIGIGLAGLLAVIMIIIGGITYMMSDVIGEKEGGKDMITNAIFGLLLAVGSYAILNTINPNIVQMSFLTDSGTTSGGGSTNTPGQLNESCQNQSIACTSSNCPLYASMIDTVAGSDADMKKVLKALMVEESACDITQTSIMTSSGQAYGLFQFQVPTANANKSGCTTATIDEAWLHNPAHAQESICIAKNYANYLKNLPSAEGKWRNVFAAYDGGNGALMTSVNCPDDISCLNGTNVKRWECPWDNTTHTQPNTGYVEARNAVKKLNYCFENPGF